MIEQINMYGKNKVEVAIERLKLFEPPEDGYYLAFSGGKDSVVIKALADMAGVKYDAHYSHTSVDPPELIRFIKDVHTDVIIEYPRYKDGTRITMWNLIPRKKMPPTRFTRYCCEQLKETGGNGRFVITGVRWAESVRRKSNRAGLEIDKGKKLRDHYDPDNPPDEHLYRMCPTKGKHILNPIIDWTTEEVWEFIHRYNVAYCKLYDEGCTRLGCIGCPMNAKQQSEGLEKYPKYKQAYIRAFDRMLQLQDRTYSWDNGEDVMNWWLGKKGEQKWQKQKKNLTIV
jgi:phosphoadenosine phosphosulfate reductase